MLRRGASDPNRRTMLVNLSPGVALPVAAALFVTITAVRFVAGDVSDAVSFLYALPVALIAVTFGAEAGVASAALGIALFGSWVMFEHPDVHLLGWISRASVLLVLGSLLGLTAERLRASQRRYAATLESMLDPFMVFEPVVDLDGRLIDVRPIFANATARRADGNDRGQVLTHPLLLAGGECASVLMDGLRYTYETRRPLVIDGLEADSGRLGQKQKRLYDVRAFFVDDMIACTWRDVTGQRELQNALAARRQAGDINDSIVQRLAVAKWMLEAGNTETGMQMVGETMEVAQRLVTDLLGGDIRSGLLL